jgi:hypothetical protein
MIAACNDLMLNWPGAIAMSVFAVSIFAVLGVMVWKD